MTILSQTALSWKKYSNQFAAWSDARGERRLRADNYMPPGEIKLPENGTYSMLTFIMGHLISRELYLDHQQVYDQKFMGPFPSRHWMLTWDQVKFFWEDLGAKVLIRAQYPDEGEHKAFVEPGGLTDNPELFNRYRRISRPFRYLFKYTPSITVGIPEGSSPAGRRRYVKVVDLPARPNGPDIGTYYKAISRLEHDK